MYKIIEHRTLCRQPGRYVGWPGIGRTVDGTIHVAFSGDRDAHVCPYGKVFLTRSYDEGETWEAPRPIINTPLDDRDAAIVGCSDGTLLLNFFTLHMRSEFIDTRTDDPAIRSRWKSTTSNIPRPEVEAWTQPGKIDPSTGLRGHWIVRSTDGGETWDDFVPIPVSSTNPPIQCHDGRILYLGNTSMDRDEHRGYLAVLESADSGKSWSELSRIPMYTSFADSMPDVVSYLGEAALLEVEPGQLIAAARHQLRPYDEKPENCTIWRCFSSDGGKTWTEPEPTDIVGKPPHLTNLPDGRVLLSYGYRFAPFGIRASVSDDGGKSWHATEEIVLRDDGPNDDLGYPQSLVCTDGTILTVYYQILPGDTLPSILLTRWRLLD